MSATTSTKRKFNTIDEYMESQSLATRRRLRALGRAILRAAPKAKELLNYDILAYALVKGGKRDKQIMTAGYGKFVGFYPGSGILEHFKKKLRPYKFSKASVQFPNDLPLPEGLIVEIVKFKLKPLEDGR